MEQEEKKLSEKLHELGFHNVHWTTENPGGQDSGVRVETGIPCTYDHNNGMHVCYDEIGRAWIRRRNKMSQLQRTKYDLIVVALRPGAFVPHSNGCPDSCVCRTQDM